MYKDKGCGFLEAVYQECLAIECDVRNIPFEEQPALKLEYKGVPLKHGYQPDFICYGKIIVEIKAVKGLADEHRAQVHNYLKATGYELGFLINFSHYPKAQIERIVL